MSTDNTYDAYCFHDNLIHGFKFTAEDFVSDLIVDIDHILEWPDCGGEGEAQFRVVAGDLRFTDVTDLKVEIIWPTSGYTTAVTALQIDRVERREVVTTMRFPNYFSWEIVMTDGRSKVSFGASAVSFYAKGSSLEVDRQYLTDAQRICGSLSL